MKISLTQENLNRAIGLVSKVVATRGSLPVLSNILISTEGKRLKLAATNLEMGITYWVGCTVEAEGSITVPARLFADFVTSLPNSSTLELTANGAVLGITTEHHKTHINGIDADEFPPIPGKEGKATLTLPSSQLREALSEVIVATSVDEARPVLAGVYMYSTDANQVTVVATDSYRLAERKITVADGSLDGELAIIVPTKTIQELVRILGDTEADVSIYASENQVVFEADGAEITSRLVEGQFPNYQQIIPSESETVVEIDTKELARVTKVASLFARQNAGGIKIDINRGGHLEIRSTSSEVGDNESSADCKVVGEDAEVSLNARYLTEALSIIKTKKVSFGVGSKVSPCVVRPLGKDADEYTYIIMPLRS